MGTKKGVPLGPTCDVKMGGRCQEARAEVVLDGAAGLVLQYSGDHQSPGLSLPLAGADAISGP